MFGFIGVSSLLLIKIYPVHLVYLVYISNINKLTNHGQHKLHRFCLNFELNWDAVFLLEVFGFFLIKFRLIPLELQVQYQLLNFVL